MGLWPAPRALKGGHGERLRRREQPQQAPSGQGEESDEISVILGPTCCTRLHAAHCHPAASSASRSSTASRRHAGSDEALARARPAAAAARPPG